jgi:hypothetical protein
MRASDIIGRLGGEEFAAVVPEPMEGAIIIAERLRTAFEAAGVTVGEHAIGATVSIGAATSFDLVTDIDGLIARADGALYSAKRGGRNRICTAENASAPSHGVGGPVVAAGRGRTAKRGLAVPRKAASRRPKGNAPAALGEAATSRLPYSG